MVNYLCASFTVVSSIIVSIIAISTPWYWEVSEDHYPGCTVNALTSWWEKYIYYDGCSTTTEDTVGWRDSCDVYIWTTMIETNCDHVENVWDSCFALSLTSIFCLATAFIILVKRHSLPKPILPTLFFLTIAFITSFLAFFLFLGLSKAYQKDFAECDLINWGLCQSLSGDRELGAETYNWKPGPGWWVQAITMVLNGLNIYFVHKYYSENTTQYLN